MDDSIKAGIITWERRRIWFNVLIGAIGFLFSFHIIDEIGVVTYIALALLFGVSMNICFSLGPLFEIYVGLFTKADQSKWRTPLFVIGMFVTIIFTIATASNFGMMVRTGNFPPSYGTMP